MILLLELINRSFMKKFLSLSILLGVSLLSLPAMAQRPGGYYEHPRHGSHYNPPLPPVHVDHRYDRRYDRRDHGRYDFYGDRYVRHNGRVYDQCSSSDRNAAALVGIVLGGAIGSQVADDKPEAGAVLGAVIVLLYKTNLYKKWVDIT